MDDYNILHYELKINNTKWTWKGGPGLGAKFPLEFLYSTFKVMGWELRITKSMKIKIKAGRTFQKYVSTRNSPLFHNKVKLTKNISFFFAIQGSLKAAQQWTSDGVGVKNGSLPFIFFWKPYQWLWLCKCICYM